MDEEGLAFLAWVQRFLVEEGVLRDGAREVVAFKHPEELKKILNLTLDDPGPASLKDLESMCRTIVKYSVKTSHPHFHNQLYAGVDLFGLAGTWISEALNTNQYTFEVAPAFTLAEQTVIGHVLAKIGFEEGDGIFCPGGSIANMYGMVLARYKLAPDVKTKGICQMQPLVAFTSEESHYSFQKGVHWLGIGTDNLVKVKTDQRGRMRVEHLEVKLQEAIAAGKQPFFVNATSGTTVLGAFDPLEELADVCSKYGVWLHVDACWGGSLLLSKTHKYKLAGLHRADSVTWNPHKMLGAPLQCTIFLVRHKDLMHLCNSASATYLFQQDKFYDVRYDTGDKSVQCGRKVDAFKLYVMWKRWGDAGLEALVDSAMACANYLKEKISQTEGFRLVLDEVECTNVCFWYIPPRLRGMEENEDWWNLMEKVAPSLKEKLIKAGTLMIGYTPLGNKGLKNFFRMVTTCQPRRTTADMDYVIDQIVDQAQNL